MDDVIDLKRHAWRHKFNGFPIYGRWEDGEENDIIGVIAEPLWKWGDLSETDKATVHAEAAGYRSDPRGADLSEDMAFFLALGEWGVACPHLHWTYHEPVFRECKACRVSEQLPGVVVYIEGKAHRVSNPPPRRLRIPRPSQIVWTPATALDPTGPALEIDEYEWIGSGYRKV